jgi:mono/diheme cytochrome c family protein
MSSFLVKSLIACVFLLAGTLAFLSMMTLMGRAEKKADLVMLRRLHRVSGYAFAILLIPLAVLGLRFVRLMGDGLPPRGVLHAVLALSLLILLILKLSIVRFYRQFLKHVPVMGMSLLAISFVIFMMTAGFFLLRAGTSALPDHTVEAAGAQGAKGIQDSGDSGAVIFKRNCGHCHRPDSEDYLAGPGLKDLLKNETLPASSRPATVENVRSQLLRPLGNMPAFRHLSQKEIEDLLAHLKTL